MFRGLSIWSLSADLTALIQAVGYVGLFIITLADSGLLIGLFLPGDSLLFTAGLLASQDYFRIELVIIACFLGAVIGDNIGYAIGRHYGPKIFSRTNSLFLDRAHLERTRKFYHTHGGKVIVLARFIHGMRTIAPMLAGAGKMPYASFVFYNIFGGCIWVVGVSLLGYYVGGVIPHAERYALLVVLLIAAVSFAPTAMKLIKHRKRLLRGIASTKDRGVD